MSLHDIENRAKRLLEPFPGVKRAGKRVYQYTGYALSRNKIKSEGELVRLTPDDGMEYFFGYYDKCPWTPTARASSPCGCGKPPNPPRRRRRASWC